MTFFYSPPLHPLIVQYLVALVYSIIADVISLGYYFERTQNPRTSVVSSGEGLYV